MPVLFSLRILRSFLLGLLFTAPIASIPAIAQIATGSYPYAPIDNKGIDTINLGNLNIHLEVPIFSKPGRGIPFTYALNYDNSIWAPSGSGWGVVQNFGWTPTQIVTTGYITYIPHTYLCDTPPPFHNYYTYDNFVYHDPWGVTHNYAGQLVQDPTHCYDPSVLTFTEPAFDSSGYILTATGSGAAGTPNANQLITNKSGTAMLVPVSLTGTSSVTDLNGNQISLSTSGVYTDTVGSTVMTVSGSAPSNVTFTYPTSTGGTATYTMKYTSYNIKTNFGCSGIAEASLSGQPLVSEIDLPDGSKYLFAYETTPGYSGYVTGRMASVTLPSGGQIAYTYTGSNNGIVCADGSTMGITRVLSNDPAGSTWTYSRTPSTSTSSTAVTDGLGNSSNYDFVLPTSSTVQPLAAQYVETHRNVYEGSASGTPLLARGTCYNGTSYPCTTSSITWPISQVDTYETLNGSQMHGSTVKVNAYGFQTEEDDFDFGTSSRGSLLRKELWTYPTTGLVSILSEDTVYDGSSDVISDVTYEYDQTTPSSTSGLPQHVSVTGQRGNLTEMDSTGSTWTYTTDDAGQRTSMVDPIGNTTTYTYDSTADAFLTQTTTPVVVGGSHLSTSATWDDNSGVMLSSSDMNSNTTTYSYDSMLRPTGVSYPDGGSVTNTYTTFSSPSTWATVTQAVLHQSGSTVSTVTTVDAYARPLSVTMADGSATDTVLYGYDGNGNSYSTTNPYRTTGDSTYGVTYNYYDALGRITSVTEADGSSKSYSYSANTTTTTDEVGNQRQLVTDGIGRLSRVNEPDTSTSFNYATQYQYFQNYSSGTYQTVITQKGGSSSSGDWRVRSFTYDEMGRTVQETTPEAGTTTYDYGSAGLCAGDPTLPCKKTDALTNDVFYTYDGLNRLYEKRYDDLITPNAYYSYDQTSYNGLSITNGKGLRTGMSDGSGATAWSFDSMGRPLAERKTINSVTKQSNYTYYLDGTVNTLQDYSGTTFTYSYDSNSRQTGVSDGSGNTYASGATYDAAGQLTGLTHQLTSSGATYTRSFQFNHRLQPGVISATLGSSTIQSLSYGYGTSGYNNGNIMAIANGVSSGRSQSYSYDLLNRLVQGYDSNWGENYTYDPWGNMVQRSQISGHGGDNWTVTANASNQLSNLTYDADGHVTQDQFSNSYTYDSEHHPLTAGTGSYVYDGDGNRVEKTVGSTTTLYWPAPSGGILDESNSGATSFGKQVYLAGLQVWSEDTSGSGKFLFQDHLGSTRISGSASGTLYDDIDYLPFGEIYANYGTASDVHYLFTGYETDSESSTNYAINRNQSPSMARFNQPDPYDGSYDQTNPQSLNRYSYVLNNPLVSIDPLGLDGCNLTTSINGNDVTTESGCIAAGGIWVDSTPNCVNAPGVICVGNQPCTVGGSGRNCSTTVASDPSQGGGNGGGANGGGGETPQTGGVQSGGGGAGPSNVTCAGKTTLVSGNIRIQANAAGVITAVGIPLTGASGYQITTDYGINFQIQPSTIVGVGLNPNGSLSVGVNHPIYISSTGSFFGGYVSSLTFSNGAFTQVNGSVSFLGIHGSTSTPSSRLATILNSNSGLANAAQLLQSAAQLAQSIVGCKVGG